MSETIVGGKLEDKISSFNVRRTHGTDLSTTMGRLLFQDVITSVLELVANSYDADSTHVGITYEPENNLLVISDNGSGMNIEAIKSFFRVGDSTKRMNPISPNGRKRIGEFGIATLALKSLAHHYSLETTCDNVKYKLEETIDPRDRDDKPLEVNPTRAEGEDTGTNLILDDLAFLADGRQFTIEELKRRLSIEMPISKDFTVSVNNQVIAAKEDIRSSREYILDIDDSEIGKISGAIFYSRKGFGKDAGVYIKVHGRAVGGANQDIFGEAFRVGLAKRLYGFVHADGLRPLIGLDRKSFLKDHPYFQKVTEYVLDVLRQIRQDEEMDRKLDNKGKTELKLDSILSAAARDVRDLVDPDGPDYKIELNEDEAGEIAYLDHDERVLYVNPNSPALGLAAVKRAEVRMAILKAAEFALVQGSLPIKGNARDKHKAAVLGIARKFQRFHKNSLSDLIEDQDSEEYEGKFYRISPARLYTFTEISKITGWSNAVIKRMANSKVIHDRGDERILGAEIPQVQQLMGGRLCIYDAVRVAFPNPKGVIDYAFWQNREDTANRRLDKIADKSKELPPYIRNIAPEGEPSFWIADKSNMESYKKFMETGKLPIEGTLTNPRFSYCKLHSSDEAAVFYLLEFEGEMDENSVRKTTESRLKTIKDLGEGDLPAGIKTKSWCSNYEGKRYILGIFAGDFASAIKEVAQELSTEGFTRKNVLKTGIQTIYDEVINQRSSAWPLYVIPKFPDNVASVLEQMLK